MTFREWWVANSEHLFDRANKDWPDEEDWPYHFSVEAFAAGFREGVKVSDKVWLEDADQDE